MAQLAANAKLADIIASLTASEGINQKQTGIVLTFDQAIPIGLYDGTPGSGKVQMDVTSLITATNLILSM
jgi:hypothetical protein